MLDEKHVLKRAARGIVPEAVLARKKQPYRAPDALSFAEPGIEWIDEVASDAALAEAGVFAPHAARQLLAKCRAQAAKGQFSNADNMAIVGLLSTQLVYDQFIRQRPTPDADVPVTNPRGSRGGCSSDFTVTSAGPRDAQAPPARLAVGRI